MTKTVIKILIFFIITSGCGYKVLKYSELSEFEINKIEATGNNEINFKIKRKLNSLSKVGSDNKIDIYLQTSKDKFVKEKDSKNEVSKYQIDIVAKLEVTSISNKNILNFSIKKLMILL